MRSNICKIEKGTRDLEAIFKESEKVAEYNGLSDKQALQLRLICEEIDGMLPNIIDDFDGELWIDFEDGVCKVNVRIRVPDMSAEDKEELIGIAKNKKNAAAVGVIGKIRNAIEDFLLNSEKIDTSGWSTGGFGLATGYSEGVDYSYVWRLNEYKSFVKIEDKKEAWDELEKSVIASVSDDVVVGVKGKCVEVVVTKKFA